ncbi:monocarboxylate transporter 10 [Eurytemora carolleeae]|uniref:monocarboxylate transporter 10 n=1 Tax=Eurytemora carolleeae TaxID=1294199 RepID=UPI000C75F957|nr:monocarboxylate transporter 10 [Eurytemora carolleeae]|eukprot:XP_023341909.1 monocarboxylate transporter 10-like [Eurytemora affinis]
MLIGLALVPKVRGQHNGEQKMFNINILRKSSFLLVLIGNVPTVMAVYALYSYLPMLAESTGLAKLESSYLISAVGITNTLGRILAGWIADLPHISALRMTTLASIIAGILPSIFLLCSSHATFLILSSLFGLIISVIPSVTSALIVEILGKQDLSSGFGMLTFVRGIAALAGPPISGLIHDTTNSYSASFYLASVELIASGLIHGCVVLLLHKRRHQYQAI